MATTPTAFFRGAATLTTTTVLGTVPASTTWIVTNIAIVNTAATSATYTLGMGTAGANTSIATTAVIPANSTAYVDLKQVLATTNTITGGASATTVNFHISGVALA